MQGTGLIIYGKKILVDGLNIINYEDEPKLKLSHEDGALRKTKWIKQIILHTTLGIPDSHTQKAQSVNFDPPKKGFEKTIDTAQFWSRDPKCSAAHLIIEENGVIGQVADLGTMCTFHAAQRMVNESSCGIELRQSTDSSINKLTIEAAVKLVDALTTIFGIQRQVHLPYKKNPIQRLSKGGGKNCVGVFGHRDCSANRGFGDPGDLVMNELVFKAGYERFDFEQEQDLEAWTNRQKSLNLKADGVPGPATLQALKDNGYINGIWTAGHARVVIHTDVPGGPMLVPELPNVKSEDVIHPVADANVLAKLLEFFKNLFSSK